MLFLLMALVWVLVSAQVVGGAILFQRLFPRESPWFGFVVPALAATVALNFVEHLVALPSLGWLGAITFLIAVGLIVSRRTRWRFLKLPTIVFLGAFTFALFLRGLKPDIAPIRDGITDLHFVCDFCMGEKLPPDAIWLPGFKLQNYYALPQYGASVLIRLLGFDPGTGFNVASALVAAWSYVLIGAVAWRVGGQRKWIVALCVVLTASALNGSTPLLWLFYPNHKDPDDMTNLLGGSAAPGPFPFDFILHRMGNYWNSRELLPPGYYSWIGGLHSVMTGQLIVLLAVYALVEMFRARRTNMPWICALGAVLLMTLTSTWGMPVVALMVLAALGVCAFRKIGPRDWRVVTLSLAAGTVALAPMLLDFLRTTPPTIDPNVADARTQFFEFLIQWWPVFVPGVLLLFWWRRMHPLVRILQIVLTLAFVVVENYDLADRIDMTGKLWSDIFIAGWAVFIPAMAGLSSLWARTMTVVLVLAAGVSFCFWIDYEQRTQEFDDRWHLDGWGELRGASDKGRIFNILMRMNHRVVLTGKPSFYGDDVPSLLSCLTHNSVYVTCSFHDDGAFYPNTYGEATRRFDAVNAIYSGKNPAALAFLRAHDIAAMVIWPDDKIGSDFLAELKSRLLPDYDYDDCRDPNPPTDEPNAGIFIRRDLAR
jgi:hypothetical protein